MLYDIVKNEFPSLKLEMIDLIFNFFDSDDPKNTWPIITVNIRFIDVHM